MLGQLKERNNAVLECIHVDLHGKAVSNGLCYLDSATVKLQVMQLFFALCSPVSECNSILFFFLRGECNSIQYCESHIFDNNYLWFCLLDILDLSRCPKLN